MLFFLLINVKMPTAVGILTVISRKTFIPSWVEQEFFVTSGPVWQNVLIRKVTFSKFEIFMEHS